MNKVLRAIVIVLCFEMGALLLYLPWSRFWEKNYFLFHYPSLMPLALHPSVRGLITGLGFLDIIIGVSLLQSRPETPSVTPR